MVNDVKSGVIWDGGGKYALESYLLEGPQERPIEHRQRLRGWRQYVRVSIAVVSI